jgi:predicted nucleic acid-binding Zn ribbon protein
VTGSQRARRTVPLGKSLAEVSRRLEAGSPEVLSTIFSRWPELVGSQAAEHTWPERVEGDALVVNADSAAWASHLRTLSAKILDLLGTRVNAASAPSRVVVRVRASSRASRPPGMPI